MINNKKIIAIIPVRGGSKGLPRKNIRLFAGKPLVAWTIEEAKCSKYIDKIIVSTEDEEIAEISKNYNAEVIIRPEELASDFSPVIDSIFHVINTIKYNYEPHIIVQLQATSPLRTVDDIDSAIDLFNECDCDSVISMSKVDSSPYWYFTFDHHTLKPLFGLKYFNSRRQDLEIIYKPNGSLYITSIVNLSKNNGFYCKKIVPYIMPTERSIDINEEIDFKLAELLFKKNH